MTVQVDHYVGEALSSPETVCLHHGQDYEDLDVVLQHKCHRCVLHIDKPDLFVKVLLL